MSETKSVRISNDALNLVRELAHSESRTLRAQLEILIRTALKKREKGTEQTEQTEQEDQGQG